MMAKIQAAVVKGFVMQWKKYVDSTHGMSGRCWQKWAKLRNRHLRPGFLVLALGVQILYSKMAVFADLIFSTSEEKPSSEERFGNMLSAKRAAGGDFVKLERVSDRK